METNIPPNNSHNSSDDDEIQLSAHALAALQEFYNEQENLSSDVTTDQGLTFQENWQLSQFWYDDHTSNVLAKEAIHSCEEDSGRIACISCPTLYRRLREIKPDTITVKLFEYDKRFSIYEDDFVYYDYKQPLQAVSSKFVHAFDIVIADPPFLSEECLTKMSTTIQAIAKRKIVVCTGATMEQLVTKLMNLHVCSFIPKHSRNLGNEFRCYANYDFDKHVNEL